MKTNEHGIYKVAFGGSVPFMNSENDNHTNSIISHRFCNFMNKAGTFPLSMKVRFQNYLPRISQMMESNTGPFGVQNELFIPK